MRLISYFILFQLTLNILVASTVMAACKDHIGKTYWVYPENNSLISTPGKPYRYFIEGNKPTKVSVTGCTDLFQSVLRLESGDVVYADSILIGLEQMDSECRISDGMKQSYFFASDPGAAVRSCEEVKAKGSDNVSSMPLLTGPASPVEKESKKVVRSPNLKMGMTKKQVIKLWGEPEEKHSIILDSGYRQDQWVYRYRYIYFTNGKLSAIQY